MGYGKAEGYDAMVNAAAVYFQEGMGLPKHVWNHEAPAGGLVLAVCADVIPIRRGTRCSTSPRQPPSSPTTRHSELWNTIEEVQGNKVIPSW